MTDHASALRPRPMCNGARTSVARLGRPLAAALALWALSAAAVNVDAPNRAPLADAGAPQTALVGQRVALDAGASSDADGDRLSYHWTLVSTPRGSAARLRDPHALRPQFDIDLLGDYVAELVVSDGVRDSAPRHVVVSTGNAAPVAVAPPGGTLARGDAIVLSSAASYDADGDALSARWSLIEQPASGRASLRRHGAGSALLQANASGDYLLQLIVNDGRQDSAPVQVRYSTVESAPLADAGDDRVSILGARLRLNGSRSLDSDGDALGYRWALLHAPAGSAAGLSATDTPHPTLAVDVAGLYVAQLIVSDAGHDSAADTVVIEARAPGGGALVELSQLTGQLDHSGPSRGGGSDVDGDGIPDLTDNCVEVFNPDQRDTNGDGFGNICDPDLDNDGFITNTVDLGLLRAAFFSSPGDANWNPDADFDGDGAINTTELGIIKSYFFGPPGPIAINFINPAGGSWHDANNWSLGVVPTTVHSVRISLAPGVVVTYSSGSTEIASLRAFSDFTLAGGNLSVVGSMQVNAPFTVSGGTLANATIGAPLTSDIIQVTGNATFDGITLAQDMTIDNARTVTVLNGLTLSGTTVTLASTGSFSRLSLAGSVGLLDGSGEIVFGGTTTNDSRNELYRSGSGVLTVGPNITVRSGTTGGRVNSADVGQPLVFEGTVISDVPGRTVTLRGTPTTLAASAAININGGNVTLDGAWTNEGTITGTGGNFDTGTNNSSAWDNNGVIALTGTTTELSGIILVANIGNFTSDADILFNGRLELGAQSFDLGTLPGNFIINGGIIADGTLINTPLAISTVNLTLDSIVLAVDMTIDNARTVTVLNGLTLSGTTVTLASTGSFSRLSLAGSVGLLDGSGEIVFGGTTTNDSRNELYRSGSGVLTVGPNITVRSGTTGGRVNSADVGQPLVFEGTVISDVPGRTVTLRGTPTTLAASAAININGGNVTLDGAWTNEGTITGTGGNFDTGTNNSSAWDNNGVIALTGTTTELSGIILVANIGNFTSDADILFNGRLELGAQSFDLGTLPGNFIINGGIIADGTLINTPLAISTVNLTLDSIVLAVDMTIDNARTVTVLNGLTLNGATVTLASSSGFTRLSLAGSVGLLDGSGEIVFGGTTTNDSRNELYRSGSGVLTVGPNITVRSGTTGGRVNSADVGQPLVFEGTVISDVPGRTVTLRGTPTTLAASAAININGGNVTLDGAWTNEGTITGTGGNFDTGTNNSSAWDNNGVIALTGTTTELSGIILVANIGNFTSDADILFNGRLELGAQSFDLGTLPGNFIINGGIIADGTLINTPLAISTVNLTLDSIVLAVDMTIDNARTVTVLNGLTLSGTTVTLASTGSFSRLSLAGSVGLLDGSGEIVFGGTTTNDSRNELYRSGSGVLTVGPNITVRSGTTGGRVNSADVGQPLVFEGTVISDVPGRTVTLRGTPTTLAASAAININGGNVTLDGAWTNEGTITGTGGNFDTGTNNSSAWDNNGVIALTGTTTELSGIILVANIGNFTSDADILFNGRLELGAQSFDLGTLPGNFIINGGIIADGTLINTPLAISTVNLTLDSIVLAVDMTIDNARTVTVLNGLTLSGTTVTLASTGSFSRLSLAGSVGLLDGSGEIVFGGTTTNDTRNEIYRGGSGVLTVGPNITVRSGTTGGRVNSADVGQPLVFEGTLIADLPGRTVALRGSTVAANGSLQAGAGATVAFNGTLTIDAAATLSVDIGGTNTTDYGRFTSSSAATLGGTLAINLVNGFTPALGNTFEVLTFPSRTGTFDSETGTDIGGGQALQVNYNATDVTLETVAAP